MADSAATQNTNAVVKIGRPKIELDPEQLYNLARIGLPKKVIADYFGVSKATLDRRLKEDLYAEAYRGGHADLKQLIAAKLYEHAFVKDNVAALFKLADFHNGMGAKPGMPGSMEAEVEDGDRKTTVRLRWTPEMDEDFEEFLAHEKEFPTIDVSPTPTEQDVEAPEPDGDADVPQGDLSEGG